MKGSPVQTSGQHVRLLVGLRRALSRYLRSSGAAGEVDEDETRKAKTQKGESQASEHPGWGGKSGGVSHQGAGWASGSTGRTSGTAQVRCGRGGAGGPQSPHARGLGGPAPLAAAPNQRPGPTLASGPQLVACRPSADALANGPLRCLGASSPPPPRLTFREHLLCTLGRVPTSSWTAAHSALTQTPWRGAGGAHGFPTAVVGPGRGPCRGSSGPGLPEDMGPCVSCPQKGTGTALGAKLPHELALEARAPAVQALRSDLPGRLPRASP